MGRFTEVEMAEVWERRQAGEPTRVIARRLGRNASSIRRVFENTGGVCPARRRRSPRHLSLTEREEISRGVAAGESLRVIAGRLGRAPSTVSREVTRNGGRHRYRAHWADQAALVRARRPKECKLAQNPKLRRLVEEKLADRWSPEQISGWLRRTYPDEEGMQVSHETIYLSLFIQSRGGLKRELTQHLRTRRVNRRPKGKRPPSGKGQIGGLSSNFIQRAALEFNEPLVTSAGLAQLTMDDGDGDQRLVPRFTLIRTKARPGAAVPLGWTLSERTVENLGSQLGQNGAEFDIVKQWLNADLECTEIPPEP